MSQLDVGTRATLSVRPELVRVARASGAGESRFAAGSIADVIYLGSRTRAVVALAGDETLLADLREHEIAGLESGVAVSVDWDPESATVWPTEQREGTTA